MAAVKSKPTLSKWYNTASSISSSRLKKRQTGPDKLRCPFYDRSQKIFNDDDVNALGSRRSILSALLWHLECTEAPLGGKAGWSAAALRCACDSCERQNSSASTDAASACTSLVITVILLATSLWWQKQSWLATWSMRAIWKFTFIINILICIIVLECVSLQFLKVFFLHFPLRFNC